MNKTKTIIISIISVVALIVLLLLYGVFFGSKDESPYAVEAALSFWGVDYPWVMEDILAKFSSSYPNVEIDYKYFENINSYETALLDALAAGRGPDIFAIRNNDLFRKLNKISPLPTTTYSPFNLDNDFPGIVRNSFVSNGRVYALPLTVDTLVLFYNKDLLNSAGIVFAPKTWGEFNNAVEKLTDIDGDTINIAGAAIGTGSANIDKAEDILSLLMLQMGVKMVSDDYREAQFFSRAGEDALRYYVSFANPSVTTYTWNNSLKNARDLFGEGKLAMMFDYADSWGDIRNKAPLVDIGVATVPQPVDVGAKTSYANFWGYTVSNQSDYKNVAWNLIGYLATNEANAEAYLKISRQPPALLSLIDKYITNEQLSVFARQSLTARSWAEPNPDAVDDIFSTAINATVNGKLDASSALREAENKVTRLMQPISALNSSSLMAQIWDGRYTVTCNIEGPCGKCDAIKVASNIFDFLVQMSLVLAALAITYGAFLMLLSGGSEERYKKGKDTIYAAIIGIVIALGAWVIINSLLHLASGDITFPWSQIKC